MSSPLPPKSELDYLSPSISFCEVSWECCSDSFYWYPLMSSTALAKELKPAWANQLTQLPSTFKFYIFFLHLSHSKKNIYLENPSSQITFLQIKQDLISKGQLKNTFTFHKSGKQDEIIIWCSIFSAVPELRRAPQTRDLLPK